MSIIEPSPAPKATTPVEQLAAKCRQLWNRRPTTDPAHREHVLTELADIDLALERLALRAASNPLRGLDIDILERCSQRLDFLDRTWVSPGTAPTGSRPTMRAA